MHFTDSDMAKVGVEIINFNEGQLRCKACGVVWTPMKGKKGRLPRGYWHCPNGHNVPHGLDEPSNPEHIKAWIEATGK